MDTQINILFFRAENKIHRRMDCGVCSSAAISFLDKIKGKYDSGKISIDEILNLLESNANINSDGDFNIFETIKNELIIAIEELTS